MDFTLSAAAAAPAATTVAPAADDAVIASSVLTPSHTPAVLLAQGPEPAPLAAPAPATAAAICEWIPIKPQFLAPRVPRAVVELAAAASSSYSSSSAAVPAAAAAVRSKGQNKKRKVEELGYSAGAADNSQLCRAIMVGSTCRYGNRCRNVHDVAGYLASKPPDLGPRCHVFELRGECAAGLACRFGDSHTDRLQSGKQLTRTPLSDGNGAPAAASAPPSSSSSSSSAPAAPEEAGQLVDDAAASVSFDGHSSSSSSSSFSSEAAVSSVGPSADAAAASAPPSSSSEAAAPAAGPSADVGAAAAAASSARGPSSFMRTEEFNFAPHDVLASLSRKKYKFRVTVAGNGAVTVAPPPSSSSAAAAVAPLLPEAAPSAGGRHTSAELARGRDSSREAAARCARLDLRNRLYIAPLTTVGNLPFRRIMVEQGADVTCGEMAMGPSVLSGERMEWALLRRHASERVFGVQIGGAHADVVAHTVELLADYCPRIDFIDLNMGCPLDAVCGRGMGAALMGKPSRLRDILRAARAATSLPLTLKMRTGLELALPERFAHKLVGRVRLWSLGEHLRNSGGGDGGAGAALDGDEVAPLVCAITVHGRTRQQRYSKSADWEYVARAAGAGRGALQLPAVTVANDLGWAAVGGASPQAVQQRIDALAAQRLGLGGGGSSSSASTAAYPSLGEAMVSLPAGLVPDIPILGNGDILSWQEYYSRLEGSGTVANMLARGALIKPWLPREIRERIDIDISSGERLDILRTFVNYGLEHWGSDQTGVNRTRRFLLEWLAFLWRYVPVGLMERLPQRMIDRAPAFVGRDELETLMGSPQVRDWVRISELLLGPVPSDFVFLPKHKSSGTACPAGPAAAAGSESAAAEGAEEESEVEG